MQHPPFAVGLWLGQFVLITICGLCTCHERGICRRVRACHESRKLILENSLHVSEVKRRADAARAELANPVQRWARAAIRDLISKNQLPEVVGVTHPTSSATDDEIETWAEGFLRAMGERELEVARTLSLSGDGGTTTHFAYQVADVSKAREVLFGGKLNMTSRAPGDQDIERAEPPVIRIGDRLEVVIKQEVAVEAPAAARSGSSSDPAVVPEVSGTTFALKEVPDPVGHHCWVRHFRPEADHYHFSWGARAGDNHCCLRSRSNRNPFRGAPQDAGFSHRLQPGGRNPVRHLQDLPAGGSRCYREERL